MCLGAAWSPRLGSMSPRWFSRRPTWCQTTATPARSIYSSYMACGGCWMDRCGGRTRHPETRGVPRLVSGPHHQLPGLCCLQVSAPRQRDSLYGLERQEPNARDDVKACGNHGLVLRPSQQGQRCRLPADALLSGAPFCVDSLERTGLSQGGWVKGSTLPSPTAPFNSLLLSCRAARSIRGLMSASPSLRL